MSNDNKTDHEIYEELTSEEPRFRVDIVRGIFPMAVLIYLFIGLRWNLWHPGWVIFVVAWFIEGIFAFVKTGKLKISVYGVAAVIFIVAGFVFGEWSYTWLVFVAAWVIDEMFFPKKKKKKKSRKED